MHPTDLFGGRFLLTCSQADALKAIAVINIIIYIIINTVIKIIINIIINIVIKMIIVIPPVHKKAWVPPWS